MPNFIWVPDQGAKRTVKSAVHKSSFGDGYAQRAGAGINSVTEMWSLSFSVRPKTEIDAITGFLAGLKGVSNFIWTTPRGQTLKFVCDTWDDVYNHNADCSASATFTQDFGL